jgi:hypothetical protein
MRHPRTRRPSLASLMAAVALVIACVSVTGALAAGKTVQVVTRTALRLHFGQVTDVPTDDVVIADATCPSGYLATGGGFDESGSITINLVGSKVEGNFDGWKVEVVNPPLGQAGTVQAFALCEHNVKRPIPVG